MREHRFRDFNICLLLLGRDKRSRYLEPSLYAKLMTRRFWSIQKKKEMSRYEMVSARATLCLCNCLPISLHFTNYYSNRLQFINSRVCERKCTRARVCVCPCRIHVIITTAHGILILFWLQRLECYYFPHKWIDMECDAAVRSIFNWNQHHKTMTHSTWSWINFSFANFLFSRVDRASAPVSLGFFRCFSNFFFSFFFCLCACVSKSRGFCCEMSLGGRPTRTRTVLRLIAFYFGSLHSTKSLWMAAMRAFEM